MSWTVPANAVPPHFPPPQLSGQQLSAVLESISDAVCVLDRDWRLAYVNSAAEHVLQRNRDDVLGLPAMDVFPRALAAQFRREYERAIAQNDPVHFESLYPGTDTWYEIRSYPSPGGLCIHFRDVTERRRSIEALRESEEKFRTLAEHAHALIGIVQDGRFIYTNPHLQRQTGYSRDELRSMSIEQLIHPDHRPIVMDRAARRQRGEDVPAHYDYRMITRSGEQRWMELSVARIEYRGRPALIGIAYDITARKQAEAARRESEDRFRKIFEEGPLGMALLEPDGHFTKANATFVHMLGYSEQELRTRSWRDIVHPDDLEVARDQVERLRRGEIPHMKVEKRFLAKDGSTKWGSVTLSVIHDMSGVPGHWLLMVEDITERKRHEEERAYLLRSEQTARAEAETANRRKDQFLAVLSHELRTPLTPVLARLELLKRDPAITPQARAHLNMIRRSIDLESSLISDILDISRISRGKLQLNLEPVDAHDKIEEALEIYQRDILLKHLAVQVDLRAAQHMVRADPARLEQVFWNLISNAVKYTSEAGSILVRSWNEPNDQTLKVEISDTGVGIEPEVMQRIFTPFEQGEQSLTRRFGGLGLGLAISKVIVGLHGGRIHAFSEGKNRGARFTVELPTLAQPAAQIPAAVAPAAPTARRRPARRILLVEDNQDTSRMLSRLLRKVGHRVRTAESIAAAVEASQQDRFDLVISDIGLPDGSGWELMRQLQQQQQRPTRGIALSGFGTDQDIQKSREAGFEAHLTKPVDLNRLEAAIEKVLPPQQG